ncbi:hypothetical protein CVT91_05355 [Candidatus Atribacteria bacterium HGW-Atribacteria-1]|nr:MAG: hypothetical protein CVT91_05355 [Candidatus Atribacteria bacterium HGW-Atribacteria-1]
MKKNVIIGLIAVIIIFGFIQGVQATTKDVKLEWWTVQAGEENSINCWNYIIGEFEKKYPNVKIERVDMIDEDFKTTLKSSMAAGIPPDIWFSWGGGILKAYVDAGCVADLTDLLNEPWAVEMVPRTVLGQSSFYGKHYAFPFTTWVGHFYINTDLFGKCGVNVPKEPWSWEEFKKSIKIFKENGIIPIAVGGIEKWELSFYYMYLVDRIGESEIFTKTLNRKPGYSFENPVFIEAGERIKELVDFGAFQKGFLGTGYSEAQRLFYEGKAAMYLMGSWTVSPLRHDYPEFPLDIMPFPSVPGGKGDPTMLLGAVQNHWCISEVSKHKEEAKDLFRLMFNKENIIKYAQDVGDAVVFNVDLPVGVYDPVIEKVLKDVRKASWLQMAYDQYSPPRFASVHLDNVASLFAGRVTPKEMATAQEKCAQELKKEGILPLE